MHWPETGSLCKDTVSGSVNMEPERWQEMLKLRMNN